MGRVPLEESLADRGCEICPRCLDCPLAWCVEESRRVRPRRKTLARLAEMARLRRRGRRTADIARAFAVSARTVQRALRKSKRKEKKSR